MKILPIMAALSVALIFSSCGKKYSCVCTEFPNKVVETTTISNRYNLDEKLACIDKGPRLSKQSGKEVTCDVVE